MDATARATRLRTVEARWFGAGALPNEVASWFARGGTAYLEAARTDRYLRLPGALDVGVKLREGRLELKARAGGTAATASWARRPSPLEAWLKWSAPLSALPDDPVAPVDVAKTRRLLARPSPDGAVQLELAELAVDATRHWTFGLEGASAAGLEAVLASAWAAAAPVCDIAYAGAYPGWLELMASGRLESTAAAP